MPRARLSRLGIAGAISIPLAAVNPFGVQALLFAVGTLSSPLIQNNIQEWASPDFHTMPGLLFEGILILIFAGLATRRVSLRSSQWLLALATLYLAFSSQRHVPLFVLAAAPLYGRCAQALLERIRPLSNHPPRREKELSLGIAVLNLALLVSVGVGMIADRALPNLTTAGEAAAIPRRGLWLGDLWQLPPGELPRRRVAVRDRRNRTGCDHHALQPSPDRAAEAGSRLA
ncbi:MAG: hypothetical protein E6I88_13940 [Chloroflexi bacterium]|nr:MAG: hypothetical protein E6I88_13940 [Chloroflexota bacterium]